MKYAGVFCLIAASCLYLAMTYRGWAWLLLWPAVSFIVVASAYGLQKPAILGKGDAGRIAAWAVLLLMPFFALTWSVWRLACALSREHAADELCPGIFIGRRPLAEEVRQMRCAVIDLTAEFHGTAAAPDQAYRSFPILDATAIPAERLLAIARHIGALPHPVLIHCAQGHGRTGMVAAALLLDRGTARTSEEAMRIVQACRPGIALSGGQRRAVENVARCLTAAPPHLTRDNC